MHVNWMSVPRRSVGLEKGCQVNCAKVVVETNCRVEIQNAMIGVSSAIVGHVDERYP